MADVTAFHASMTCSASRTFGLYRSDTAIGGVVNYNLRIIGSLPSFYNAWPFI
jgi:hypothetical protein